MKYVPGGMALVLIALLVDVAAEPQRGTGGPTPPPSLPRVTELPARYRPIGESLAGRDGFYAAAGSPRHRVDDGDAHHGLPATVAWAASPKDPDAGTQGLLYGVEDGVVTSAGYIIRQADLAAGKSFYGLTLRELDFPAAHSLTVDLLEGETAGDGQYLWLWHFVPPETGARPMRDAGELPPVTTLPPAFTVLRNDSHPNDFYPRMGRHRLDFSNPANRQPAATGSDSVWYGEAAGTLIFIEYIFSQQDFMDGATWSSMALDTVPIPPIDNVHFLHYNGATPDAPGRYTVHMYFLPEERYLSWKAEPDAVLP